MEKVGAEEEDKKIDFGFGISDIVQGRCQVGGEQKMSCRLHCKKSLLF